MSPRTWRCRKKDLAGNPCTAVNAGIKQRCGFCGGPRPKRRKAKHLAVLAELDYAAFVALNPAGERCAICGRAPAPGKRLQRDHDHRSGRARGALCFRCNRFLHSFMDSTWLRAALAYIERAEADERSAA